MKNKNANNFWAGSPIIMKFGMQSLWPTHKVQYAQKSKKLKIQDGRRRHYFMSSSGSRPGQTRGPILASDTSKCVFRHKEVTFGVLKDKNFSFHPKNRQKPQLWGTFNAFPMENTNNFWLVSPIIMKFGTQSLTPTPTSVVCPKIKKLQIQDGRRHHNFVCSSG